MNMIFEIAVVSILVIVSVAVIRFLNEINRNLLAIKTDQEESTATHLKRISGGVKHLCWWEYQKEKSRNPSNPIFTDPSEMGRYFAIDPYGMDHSLPDFMKEEEIPS